MLRVDVDKMQQIVDQLVSAGTLSTKLNAKDFVDASVLDDVYGGKTSLLGK